MNPEELTLRDYFAAKAMQGLLSNNALMKSYNITSGTDLSKKSYMIAENMLKQRSNQ